MPPDAPCASRRTVLALGALIVGSMGVVGFGRDVASDPERFVDAFGVVCVAVAGVFLWTAPGLCLVFAYGRGTTPGRALLQAAGLSFVLHALVSEIVKRIDGLPLERTSHLVGIAALSGLCLAVLAWRTRGATASGTPHPRLPYVFAAALPLVVGFLLAPWLVFENLNDDGIEALYIGESLSHHHFPRWPTASGSVGFGLGMLPIAWTNHWFIALLGPVECAPRLPILLALPLLFAGLLELVAWRRDRAPSVAAQAGLFLLLVVYAVVIGRNAGYNPYFCDIASPGAVDSMFLAFMVAVFVFLVYDRLGWFLLFALLAHCSRPTAALLLGATGLACLLVAGEHRWRWFGRCALAIALGVAVAWLWEKLLLDNVDPETASSYGSRSLLRRYRYLTFTDFQRFLFVIVPCGVVPFVSMMFFRAQDVLARRLTVVCAVYFCAMFVPAFISLHHYAPVMLLPAVVHWRLIEPLEGRRRLGEVAATFACLVAVLFIAWPASDRPNETYRDLGSDITVLVPPSPQWATPGGPASVLGAILDVDGATVDPSTTLVGTPRTAWYYARRRPSGDTNAVDTRYLVIPGNAPRPDGWKLLQAKAGLVLLERTDGRLHYRDMPKTGFASPAFRIERDVLHRHRGIPNGAYDLDIRDVIGGK